MSTQASPFSPRAVLLLIGFGAAVFIALLWMIGAGMTGGSTNNGGAHAGGKGLNGYAALSRLMEAQGYTVRLSQNEGALKDPGLLVLTPPPGMDGAELARVVSQRRRIGPTMVIAPKWQAAAANKLAKGWKEGWVSLDGTRPPEWEGFYDTLNVRIDPVPAGRWAAGAGHGGRLPAGKTVESASGDDNLVPLVEAQGTGRTLAGYIDDGGEWNELDTLGLRGSDHYGEDEDLYPLVLVFEPDLMNNWGLGDRATAENALRIVAATAQDAPRTAIFDMTMPGFKRSANLLTLAFQPPYLAATLCLLIAALAVGWRAFARFGPPLAEVRSIAFGKAALVANAAGLIRRSGRLHLLGPPYADLVRERLARELALPRAADAKATEAAIDRALAARDPAAKPFSIAAATLRSGRKPADLVRAAHALHALERTLTR